MANTPELYLDRKKRGVCVACAARAPLPNRVLCAICRGKNRLYEARVRDVRLAKIREDTHRRNAYRKENHLCTHCGIPLDYDDTRRCKAHKIYQSLSRLGRWVTGDKHGRTPGSSEQILEFWKTQPRVFLTHGNKEKKPCV